MRKSMQIAAAFVLLAGGTRAVADTTLTAVLTNGQEGNINPTTVTGLPRALSGTATFVVNDAHTSMTMDATVVGIDLTGSQSADTNDNAANVHIHASSDPNFTPPQTAGVVWGFLGNPFNDNNPNDIVLTPSTTGVGGRIQGKWDLNEGNNTTLTAKLPNILAGRAYINFHTAQFPGARSAAPSSPSPPRSACSRSVRWPASAAGAGRQAESGRRVPAGENGAKDVGPGAGRSPFEPCRTPSASCSCKSSRPS